MREVGGSISTSVYCKTTHTDQHLFVESAKTLLHWAEALSSSGVSCGEDEKHVTKALQKNGHSISFIH